jgi:zinc protease
MKRTWVKWTVFPLAGALGCASHKAETRPAPVEAQAPAPPVAPDEPFRAQQPAPLDMPVHFEAPKAEKRTLKNGMVVWVHENHGLPLVAVDLVIKSGVKDEPEKLPGLSDFVARMLTEGTKSRSATELAKQLEDLAVHLHAGAGPESVSVHLNSLVETLPQALDLFADVVQHPAFRSEDLERVRGLKLTELQQKRAVPQAVAADELAALLYGEKHPWGKPSGGTDASVKAVTGKDLEKFHRAYFRPNNAQITVAGDVTPDQVTELLEKHFQDFKSAPVPKAKLPALPSLSAPRAMLVDRPGLTQSQVWMGTRLFGADNPDAIPLLVANNAVGGLFTSRLNMDLREGRGISYGVRSRVSLNHDLGSFSASGGMHADKTVEAVEAMKKDIGAFHEVNDEELRSAKDAIIRSLPSLLETNDAVAGALNSLTIKGLPRDYYETLPAKVEAVTAADVKRVVAKHLTPVQWQTVVVGPASMSEDGLKKLEVGKLKVTSEGRE